MSSNSSEAALQVQNGCQLQESEEVEGQLLVTGPQPPQSFDALEEIFNLVAFLVLATVPGARRSAAPATPQAG